MPAGVADFGANTWSQILFGLASIPANYYLALAIRPPSTVVDGTTLATIEVSGGNYSRVQVPTGSGNWVATGSGIVINKNDIFFPTPTAPWGIVNTWVLCSAASAGSVYEYGDFPLAQYIRTGISVVIPAGTLSFIVKGVTESIVV